MGVSKKEAMLRKVRALLAQAEDPAATPAEAEAFSKKAEELIAQYAIDVAVLQSKGRARTKPTTVTIDTEANYRMPYVTLLTGIAEAFGCKPILIDGKKRVTLVGFESDLDMVQTLYGSLLLQATHSVIHESKASGLRDNELWRFKQSFLVGFAMRVGARLRELHREKAEEKGTGTALVLRDRKAEVSDEFARLFPETATVNGPRVGNATGYGAGQRAGDRADIGGARVNGASKRQIA